MDERRPTEEVSPRASALFGIRLKYIGIGIAALLLAVVACRMLGAPS